MTGVPKMTIYCSFCGKSQYEVEKLIAGPAVLICDECVVCCSQILQADNIFEAGLIRKQSPEILSDIEMACVDCRVDTEKVGEFFMVNDEIWKQAV